MGRAQNQSANDVAVATRSASAAVSEQGFDALLGTRRGGYDRPPAEEDNWLTYSNNLERVERHLTVRGEFDVPASHRYLLGQVGWADGTDTFFAIVEGSYGPDQMSDIQADCEHRSTFPDDFAGAEPPAFIIDLLDGSMQRVVYTPEHTATFEPMPVTAEDCSAEAMRPHWPFGVSHTIRG